MNALLLADAPFDSDESWGAFQLQHGISHQTVYEYILRSDALGNTPTYFPLFDFPRDGNQEYLLDHNQAHLSNARLLNLPGIPDLSTYDLTDEGQFRDFMILHAQVHANEDRAIGLP